MISRLRSPILSANRPSRRSLLPSRNAAQSHRLSLVREAQDRGHFRARRRQSPRGGNGIPGSSRPPVADGAGLFADADMSASKCYAGSPA